MRIPYPDFWCLLMKSQIPSTGSVQCGKGKRQIAITEQVHMNIGRSKLKRKSDAVRHFRTITPDGIPTKAAKWLERLSPLKADEFRHAWNQMIAEALTVEYEDWRRCDVVTFSDSSAVMWGREASPFTI